MFEILMGILVIILLVAEMVSRNRPKQERPPRMASWYLDHDEDDDDF